MFTDILQVQLVLGNHIKAQSNMCSINVVTINIKGSLYDKEHGYQTPFVLNMETLYTINHRRNP